MFCPQLHQPFQRMHHHQRPMLEFSYSLCMFFVARIIFFRSVSTFEYVNHGCFGQVSIQLTMLLNLIKTLYFDLYPDCRVPIFLWTLDYSESEILFSAAMHRSCAALAVLSLPLASVAAWRQLRPTTSSRSGTSILFNNAKYILYST